MKRIQGARRVPRVLLALAGVLLAGAAWAQSAAAPAADPAPAVAAEPADDLAARIGPGADAVFQAMSDYLGRAREFSFAAEVVIEEVDETSPPIEMHRKSTWAVARPDHLRITMTADAGSRISWYDGKQVTIWSREAETYGRIELAGDFDSALDELADKWEIYPPLADLVYSDLYSAISAGIQEGAYAGLHTVNGVLCHHLVFQQETIDWQIWIDAGLQRVPRRIAIRYKDLPGQPRWSADLSDWDFSPNFPPDLFSATVPSSATKIDILPAAIEGAE